MLKSTSTSANPVPSSAPQSKTPLAHGDALEHQETAQQKLESQISKLESFQAKKTEIISQINHLNHEKEKSQTQIKSSNEKYIEIATMVKTVNEEIIKSNLPNLLTPSNHFITTQHGNINHLALMTLIKYDPRLIQLGNQLKIEEEKIQKENEKKLSILSSMDVLSKKKDCIKTDLDKSRIELSQTIDALKANKTSATNDSELEHLLSIAWKKIAFADFSAASDDVAQAQNTVIGAQSLLDDSSKKLQETLNQLQVHHTALNTAQDEFVKSGKYQNKAIHFKKDEYKADFLSDPENQKIYLNVQESLFHCVNETKNNDYLKSFYTQAERHLSEAKTKLHQAETILQKANSAVEIAQLALDPSPLDTVLSLSVDETASPSKTSAPTTDDSHATDAGQVYEQVILTGVDDHLELV